MCLGTNFMCWCPDLPCFLSDNSDEEFGCKNNNQKKYTHQSKAIIGKESRLRIIWKVLKQSKQMIVHLQEKKPYAFTKKIHD